MKRFALLCAVLFALFSMMPMTLAEAPDMILSDISGLLSYQNLLDEIGTNLAYMETVGYTSTQLDYENLMAQISAMEDGQPGQVYQDAERITLSGGVHYIPDECEIENVTLLNNAVLFNFGGVIRNLSIKDEAKYFGTGKGAARSVIMERHGFAYLQDNVGDRLTAAGNSEAILFDASGFSILYALEESSVAVIGNSAEVARGYVGKNANLLDPNGRISEVEWEEGRGEEEGGSGGSGGGKGSKKEEEIEIGLYPPNIMEWVYGSKPQGGAVSAPDVCSRTGCKCSEGTPPACTNPCNYGNCCVACTCIPIRDGIPCEEAIPR